MTRKSGRFYERNRAFTLACRLIGREYTTATKITSVLNLDRPVSKKSWKNHTLSLTSFAEQQATQNMNKASIDAKEYLQRNGQIEVLSGTGLPEEIPQIDVSVDGSWGSRGWSSRQGIVDICFEETGKVLDIILKTSLCSVCSSLKSKRESGEINVIDYMERYTKHEPECLMNHEGSSSVSDTD